MSNLNLGTSVSNTLGSTLNSVGSLTNVDPGKLKPGDYFLDEVSENVLSASYDNLLGDQYTSNSLTTNNLSNLKQTTTSTSGTTLNNNFSNGIVSQPGFGSTTAFPSYISNITSDRTYGDLYSGSTKKMVHEYRRNLLAEALRKSFKNIQKKNNLSLFGVKSLIISLRTLKSSLKEDEEMRDIFNSNINPLLSFSQTRISLEYWINRNNFQDIKNNPECFYIPLSIFLSKDLFETQIEELISLQKKDKSEALFAACFCNISEDFFRKKILSKISNRPDKERAVIAYSSTNPCSDELLKEYENILSPDVLSFAKYEKVSDFLIKRFLNESFTTMTSRFGDFFENWNFNKSEKETGEIIYKSNKNQRDQLLKFALKHKSFAFLPDEAFDDDEFINQFCKVITESIKGEILFDFKKSSNYGVSGIQLSTLGNTSSWTVVDNTVSTSSILAGEQRIPKDEDDIIEEFTNKYFEDLSVISGYNYFEGGPFSIFISLDDPDAGIKMSKLYNRETNENNWMSRYFFATSTRSFFIFTETLRRNGKLTDDYMSSCFEIFFSDIEACYSIALSSISSINVGNKKYKYYSYLGNFIDLDDVKNYPKTIVLYNLKKDECAIREIML